MKNAADIAKKMISQEKDHRIVQVYASYEGYKPIDPPVKASEFSCPFCGSEDYYTFLEAETRIWFCGRVCSSSKLPKSSVGGMSLPKPLRALQWPLFCELNGIGNIYHKVFFELLDQKPEKKEFLRKFAEKPEGMILMDGNPGTGKTYCCLALCELFTRKDASAMFLTQEDLMTRWLDTFNNHTSDFINKIRNITLLIIDDFGTMEPTPNFLRFIMSLINYRLQWDNKGTVITTNLEIKKFNEYCGEALSDRLKTAKQFVFSGKSKRIYG